MSTYSQLMLPYKLSVLLIPLICISISHSIECSQNGDCSCTADEPCILNCIGAGYCRNSTLNCMESQPCTVHCSGRWTCGDVTITSNKASTISITCDGGLQACSGESILYCGVSESCSVNCDASVYSCSGITISASYTKNYDCTGNCPSTPIPFISPHTTTPSQSTDGTQSRSQDDNEFPYTIIIIIGCVVFACVLVVCMVMFVKKKKDTHDTNESISIMDTVKTDDVKAADGDTDAKIDTIQVPNVPKGVYINKIYKHSLAEENDSPAPPPPQGSVFSVDSDASLYAKQQQYLQEEIEANKGKSTRTIMSATTDASLYETQQRYLQEEINELAAVKEDEERNDPVIVMNAENRTERRLSEATATTDASLYVTQQKYLQQELEEMKAQNNDNDNDGNADRTRKFSSL